MIDFATAQTLLQQHAAKLPVSSTPARQAVGRRLAAPVLANCDAPPFAKSMMDGYAIRHASWTRPDSAFRIVGKIMAGDSQLPAVGPSEAVAIMTGAPLPEGADTVVMREQSSLSADGQLVQITATKVTLAQNILPRGEIFTSGQTVLPEGRLITPQTLGLLLETGVGTVQVYPCPNVTVLTTGSELCPADSTPGPGQIRNTNGPLLTAVLEPHAQVTELGIASDDRETLRTALQRGLAADVLVVTGGVSTGELDLVPAALEELGVVPVFHKVALKPGKPVWFGYRDQADRRCLVFGLPGNPVSSLACCVLFVFPALRYLAGASRRVFPCGVLQSDHEVRGDRPTFWPAAIEQDGVQTAIRPLRWLGSADQRCLAETNGLAYFPMGNQNYRAGETIEFAPISVW